MMKKLIVLLACLGLGFQVTSCTSKDSQADAEISADTESADLEQLEGDETLEVAADDSMGEQMPEDALGETGSTDMSASLEEAPIAEDSGFSDSQASTDIADVGSADADVPAMDETLPADPLAQTETDSSMSDSFASSTPTSTYDEPTSDSSTTVVESPEPPKAKPNIPLQKVAVAPWKVRGVWYNTIYFARPGDSLASISQMIYGNKDRKAEIIRGNPTFNSRDVRPGDKVYYNSPNRPDDGGRLITYYEDNGIAPEVYVAKSGDNIRKVSKDLLGHSNAWKEIWSSNSVESKGEIAEGTELRYWRGGAVAAAPPAADMTQEIASNEPAMPSEPEAPFIPPPPTPEEQMAQMEAPPAMEEPMGEMPPPPPPDMAQEQFAPPPPPPPPMPEPVNPPVPQMAEDSEMPADLDSETTMALGVVGLAAAALAILIVMRKKRRQRELDQQGIDNTHVGT